MRKIKIIVDSTVDLSKEEIAAIDAAVMPISVNFGEHAYLDGIDITPDEIYARVASGDPLPKTSAIPPHEFHDIFTKYVDLDMDVIYIGLGSGFSSTCKIAQDIAMTFPTDRVFVIDSENLSTGSGIQAMKIAELRNKGLSAKEIVARIEAFKKGVNCQFAVEELTYLHKGGRCSGASALFGHLFHVHPIIKVTGDRMIVYKKPRGRMSAALDVLTQDLAQDRDRIDRSIVFITHSGVTDEVLEHLRKAVSAIIDPRILVVTRAGAVISSHCGFGTIGIIYARREE